MSRFKNKTIGIVGGMGPEAGLTLFKKIMQLTDANTDQDHLSVSLLSFPSEIVDRTAFIEEKESVNPAYKIVEVIQKLEYTGAEIIGMACNTSYTKLIYDVITEELKKRNSQVKMIHMPLETCRYIRSKINKKCRVGIMVSNGTYISKVYQNILKHMNLEVVLPDARFQDEVIHRMIYDRDFGIKSKPHVTEEVKCLFDKALAFFLEKDADAIILGCTELSLIIEDQTEIYNTIIVDSLKVMAQTLFREATVYQSTQSQLL